MEGAYANIPCRDFAGDVLAQNAADLVIVPVEGLYWNDLGDPRRVYETLARMQIRPDGMTQKTALNSNNFIRESHPQIRAANCSSNRYPQRIR
jgi:hypothetical protein